MLNKLLGGVFGALKIALILSVVLNIFDKMNTTITFVDEEQIDNTMFYEPVKDLVPMIFPNILVPKEEASTENE